MVKEGSIGTVGDALPAEQRERLQRAADGNVTPLDELLAQKDELSEQAQAEVAAREKKFKEALTEYGRLQNDVNEIQDKFGEILGGPECPQKHKLHHEISVRQDKMKSIAAKNPGVKEKSEVTTLFEKIKGGSTFGDLRHCVSLATVLGYFEEKKKEEVEEGKQWMLIRVGGKTYYPKNYAENGTCRGIHGELRKLVFRAVEEKKKEDAKIKDMASIREPEEATLAMVFEPGKEVRVGVAVEDFPVRNNRTGREGYYKGAVVLEGKGSRPRKFRIVEISGPLAFVIRPMEEFTEPKDAPGPIRRLLNHINAG